MTARAATLDRPAQDLSTTDPLVGSNLGKYEIIGQLGKGGMGIVYEARDQSLARPVALKLLSRSLASDRDAAQRFHQEARLAARLHHPNAVAIFDVDMAEDTPYIVMELVRGVTAQEFLKQPGHY